MQPVMTVTEIEAFLETDFPQIHTDGRVMKVLAVSTGEIDMSLDPNERHLRPGGTVSGPAMFTLADVACYVAILAHIGPVALAVTTNLTINFLRKPEPETLICRARILKLGKRLAVVEATLFQRDIEEPVAHAVSTFSIPPR